MLTAIEQCIKRDDTVQIAARILQERNQSDSKPSQPIKKSLSSIPSALVGEIASFLDRSDHIDLSLSNRKMFVDCHSPNRLTKIDISGLERIDDSFSLNNHPHLKHLDIRSQHLTLLNTASCSRLMTLCINGMTAELATIQQFVEDVGDKCTNITTLALYNFRNRLNNALTPQLFIELIAKFPGLYHLKLLNVTMSRMESTGTLDRTILKSLCPGIKQLSLNAVNFESTLFIATSANLHSLSWSPYTRHPISFPQNCDLSKLERLCLSAPRNEVIADILQKAKRLKQICFVPNTKDNPRRQPMSEKEIENTTKMLFADYPSLEFIYIGLI